jgi:lipid-A-disaccharide synthase-like uncharacterized protein
MLDSLPLALWQPRGPLLSDGHFWAVVGWLGNVCFFSRFMVQWYATERRRQVVIPTAFWWLSLAGSLLLLSYALFHQGDLVIIFGYAFNWIPYVRNLVIHYRHHRESPACPGCASQPPAGAGFCPACGARLLTEKKSS